MGVSLHLRKLHRDSHFRTNFRVLERWGDRNWEVSASLRSTDQRRVSLALLLIFKFANPTEDSELGIGQRT